MAALLLPVLCPGQISGYLTADNPPRLFAKRGGVVVSKLRFRLRPGYHVNSNAPKDPSLIPLRLTWDAGMAKTVSLEFPPPVMERYAFSEQPLSVYTENIVITSRLQLNSNAPTGSQALLAKLRYQACNNTTCFPPKTVEVKQPIEIR